MRVVFLLFNGFQPIDLSGPWQVFATANEEAGEPRYALSTSGLGPAVTTVDGGLRMLVDHGLDGSPEAPDSLEVPPHTVIVPGGEGVHQALRQPALLAWLRQQDQHSQRTCSVCTGAFLLAATGLLDGHAVTTHWRAADRLRQGFPRLQVTDERIFCESGKYWTTAGVTAGIDLALALVERDCGVGVAQRVARRLVVYLRRAGDQRQYSQTLRLQDRAAAPFRPLLEKMEASLALPWNVDDMAAACSMSRRTFQRKFKESFGVSPMDALRNLRAERAQVLLSAGQLSRKEIARQVGLSAADL